MRFLLLTLCFFNYLFSDNYSIVFVHIGSAIPAYAKTAILQARLFNPSCDIYLIANEEPLRSFNLNDPHLHLISCESIHRTKEHLDYEKRSTKKGFIRKTSERFLYLQDLIVNFDLKNVFHLENDVLLYVYLETLLPIFETNYSQMAGTFDNEKRCVPGFVYVREKMAITELAKSFVKLAKISLDDMQVLGLFKMTGMIKPLPIIVPEYPVDPLYSTNFNQFNSIFDAAAIGQYLGGCNPEFSKNGSGFINLDCVFNSSHLFYHFQMDAFSRLVPFAIYKGHEVAINNLHIHSKNLTLFASKEMIDE